MVVNKIKLYIGRRKFLKNNYYYNKFLIFDLDISMKNWIKIFLFFIYSDKNFLFIYCFIFRFNKNIYLILK